ncbi:hypothetical protein [Streptomyces flavofungini]|uniref:hypothetical protein n=1 Tax=Streptomyces flavofungini TaxID=68200 RepID=UPI0025B00798|nr:hypothetical protein [Streptomyces flavofungini]WJV44547.1 hypothetical protein QUY26_02770 [Streptomyces flavofungini]
MSAPAPSQRTVGLVLGAVLVIVGAVIVSVAVFGGSTAPGPEPSRPPTTHPSEPTTDPMPEPSCMLYDFECQTGNSSSSTTPQPSTPPDQGSGGTSGNGELFGGTG